MLLLCVFVSVHIFIYELILDVCVSMIQLVIGAYLKYRGPLKSQQMAVLGKVDVY